MSGQTHKGSPIWVLMHKCYVWPDDPKSMQIPISDGLPPLSCVQCRAELRPLRVNTKRRFLRYEHQTQGEPQ